MPLVRIDVTVGRSPEELQAISRAVHSAIVADFTQRGRSVEAKQSLYASIHRSLESVGVAGEDVFLGYVENGPEDWTFGFGRAQYLTGELKMPSAS